MANIAFTKNKSIVFVVAVIFLVVALVAVRTRIKNINQVSDNKSRSDIISNEPRPLPPESDAKPQEIPAPIASEDSKKLSEKINSPPAGWVDPLPGAMTRITKKPFGIFTTPTVSPVKPERFSGYHNAVDLEVTPDEQNVNVSVKALCGGRLLSAKAASGYGGVAVQSCELSGQAVTVIYGHIKLSSVTAKVGENLMAGDFLAYLGTGFSSETDGERKHLHLGIHKGNGINILGYVKSKSELSAWIDPAKYLN